MSLFLLFLLLAPVSASAKDLGELSASPYQQNSTANPYGAGSPFAPDGGQQSFQSLRQSVQQSIGEESLRDRSTTPL